MTLSAEGAGIDCLYLWSVTVRHLVTPRAGTIDATVESPTIFVLRPRGVRLLLRRPEPPYGTIRIIRPIDGESGHPPTSARPGLSRNFAKSPRLAS
jgi:hypothetical protein